MIPKHFTSRKRDIIRIAIPEIGTIMVHMAYILDMRLIAQTQLPVVYLGVGILYTFIHVFVKMAESLGVATLVLSSRALCQSASHRNTQVQEVLKTCLIASCIIGSFAASMIWIYAESILSWYRLPDVWQHQAVDYLRVRGIALGLLVAGMPLTGLLRAQGRTLVLLLNSLMAVTVYILLDYTSLCGLPPYGLNPLVGSACAAIAQQAVMITGCWLALAWTGEIAGMLSVPISQTYRALIGAYAFLSIPIMIDKTTLALAKVWLARLMCLIGPQAQGAFCVIKDLEQLIFIPALAIASACTILVSRQWALQQWSVVGQTIARSCALACIIVGFLVVILTHWAYFFIGFFDMQRVCSDYAAYALATVSVLVIADVLQLILAASLRAMGQTGLVMVVRLCVITGFMVPLSYAAAHYIPEGKEAFLVVFSSFYGAGMVMSMLYGWRLYRMLRQGIYGLYQ